jgi:hypothetical protein
MDVPDSLKCKLCNSIVDEPIRLPCNRFVCRKHRSEFIRKQTSCTFCDQIHDISRNDWQVDSTMNELLNITRDARQNELKKLVENYSTKITEYRQMQEQNCQLIDEYFSNLIQIVKSRSDQLKKEIDEISERILKEKEKLGEPEQSESSSSFN